MAINKKDDFPSSTERFFYEVSASIQAAAELASRNDERVNVMIVQIQKIEKQIEKTNELLQAISNRISLLESQDFEEIYLEIKELSKQLAVLESLNPNDEISELYDKIQEINLKLESNVSKINHQIESILEKMSKEESSRSKFFDHFWTTIIGVFAAIIIAYILYLLGINSP